MSINRVILLGRIGSEIEIKHTQNGKAVCSFSFATSENYTTKDGTRKQTTEWHTILAWEKLAETIGQFCHKGSQIYIEGKIQTRNYENKEGVKIYKTEINAKKVEFLDPKPANNKTDNNQGINGNVGAIGTDQAFTVDDIPF